MSTIGVNLSIDVSKLDKSRLYKGAKGTYANLTVFIDSNPDQFGKNGGSQGAGHQGRAGPEGQDAVRWQRHNILV